MASLSVRSALNPGSATRNAGTQTALLMNPCEYMEWNRSRTVMSYPNFGHIPISKWAAHLGCLQVKSSKERFHHTGIPQPPARAHQFLLNGAQKASLQGTAGPRRMLKLLRVLAS